ncbi:MAG: SRPBCC family protein [Pyrinomonadaceae bacterium]
MNLDELTLDVEQSVEMKADIGDVFKSVLHRFGEGNTQPDGAPLNLILEEWAGGRWFRDRGEGIQHLWGHVQVIKPPVLIELSGPLFMSYPALNHIEIKLEKVSSGTIVSLRHRAIGMIDPGHREGVSTGWLHMLNAIKGDFEQASTA